MRMRLLRLSLGAKLKRVLLHSLDGLFYANADGYLTFVRDVKVRWSLIICHTLIAACLFGIQDMRLKKRLGVIYSNHSVLRKSHTALNHRFRLFYNQRSAAPVTAGYD